MDLQVVFNGVIGLIGSVAGWFLKTLWDAVKELKDDIRDIEREMNDNYVRKDDYKDTVNRIEILCNRILDKLDGKVDKP
jgi:hypothetical protein